MDEETIQMLNSFAQNDDISMFGKYHIDAVAPAIKEYRGSINTLVNLGLVDIEYQYKEWKAEEYVVFNDRWRTLKRLGSYQALIDWENDIERKNAEKIDLENRLLKSQVEFQETNNKYIELQEELISNQIITNEVTRTTNIIISIFTGAAALWYLRDFTKSFLLDYFAKDLNNPTQLNEKGSHYLTVVTIFVLLAETIAIRRIIQAQRR